MLVVVKRMILHESRDETAVIYEPLHHTPKGNATKRYAVTREETRRRLGRLKITNLSENGVSDTTRNRRSPAAVCIEPEETTG